MYNSRKYLCDPMYVLCMSPFPPLFQTVVTVRIGLKIQLEWEHQFDIIRDVRKLALFFQIIDCMYLYITQLK